MSHEHPYSKWFDSFIAFVHLYAVHLTRVVVVGGGGSGWFLHFFTFDYETFTKRTYNNILTIKITSKTENENQILNETKNDTKTNVLMENT